MSQRTDRLPPWNTGPTPRGSRRGPAGHPAPNRRPSAVYRAAIEVSLSRMVVLDRLRRAGFSCS